MRNGSQGDIVGPPFEGSLNDVPLFSPVNLKSLANASRVRIALAMAGVLFLAAQLYGPSGTAFAESRMGAPAETTRPGAPGAGEAATPALNYSVAIEGDMEPELKTALEQYSQLIALQDRPPDSLAGLRRRIDGDVERFDTVLRSEGFYGAKIVQAVAEKDGERVVRLTVSTGPVYLLSDYSITYSRPGKDESALPHDIEELGLYIGMMARASAINDAERRLRTELANRGRPRADVLSSRAVVDHRTTTLAVALEIDPGPFARFGPVQVSGSERVDPEYILSFAGWKPGERYDQAKVAKTEDELDATGLFSSVQAVTPEHVEPDGELPVQIVVAESAPRSIGAGVDFSTDVGPGGKVFWEHRNLLGRAERLKLSVQAALVDKRASFDFAKPRFLRPDQTLLADGSAGQSNTDAYDQTNFEGTLGVQRTFLEHWRGSIGSSFEISEISDDKGKHVFAVYGLPLSVSRDDTDNPLNPTRGSRIGFWVTPSQAVIERGVTFVNLTASGSIYYAPLRGDDLVLAGRAKLGSILGAKTFELPADQRFFAGGGGSIRGYEFQRVGPLDKKLDPIGGRSLVELGAEARFRVTDTIGFVPFVDGGTVFDDEIPGGDQEIRWAAGLGLRYFTSIGPLRLDLAFPINRRKGIDDRYQVYVSIGQAF